MTTAAPKNIVSLYWKIFWILMVLLIATVWAAYVDLGRIALLIALGIAITKAALVILYFMHARYSSRSVWVYAVAGFLWLMIAISLTLSDFLWRYPPPNFLTAPETVEQGVPISGGHADQPEPEKRSPQAPA